MQSKLLAFLTAFTLISCGRSENSNSSLRVTNGITLKPTDFPSVVMLYREQGDNGGICTGTWISDRVVLTAAHCFMGLPQGPNGEVTTTVNIIEPKDAVNADFVTKTDRVFVNPEWSAEENAGVVAGDLALVEFPAPAANERPRVVSLVSAQKPQINDVVVMVGYGATGVSARGDGAGVGVKRVGENRISAFADGFINFISASRTTDGSGRKAGAAQGDSGGPLFNSRFELIGVTSGGRPSPDGRQVLNEYVDLNSASSNRFFQRYAPVLNLAL